jgi:carboxyl-terminal processing protease
MAGSSRRTLFSVIFFLAVCGCLGMLFAQKAPTMASSGDADVRDSVHQFSQVYDVVEQNYAEPVNPDKAI